jgi:hypothetical protein
MSIAVTGRPPKRIPHCRSYEINVIDVEHRSPQDSSSFSPHDVLSDMVAGVNFQIRLGFGKVQDLAWTTNSSSPK